MEVATTISYAGEKIPASRHPPVRERTRVGGWGGGGNTTAEILHLPRDDNDSGVWTLLTQQMTKPFWITFLVNFKNRIVVVGE